MKNDSPKKYGKDLSRYKDPEARLKVIRKWKLDNPDKVKESNKRSNKRIKEEALSHYGKHGKMMCCWDECLVDDPDLLTLDHVQNNGAQHRGRGQKGWTGVDLYRKVRKLGWPEDFQTLCWNHQWKKEILRRRDSGIRGSTQKMSWIVSEGEKTI